MPKSMLVEIGLFAGIWVKVRTNTLRGRFNTAWGLATSTIVCLVALGCAGRLFAVSLHFSPLTFSIQARPGQVVNKTFTLTLPQDAQTTQFKAHIEDWWRSEDNRQTFYAAPGTLHRSCGLWCTINPVESSVKPGETLTIKLSVRIPENVEPGGYWAALTVDEVPDPLAPKPNGVAMVFRASISVGLFVEVSPCKRAARLIGARLDGEKIAVRMCNDGNVPLKVTGMVEFYKPGDERPIAVAKMGAEPLLPEPTNVCEYDIALPASDVLPSGKYKVRIIVDAGLDFLMGAEKELDITRLDSS